MSEDVVSETYRVTARHTTGPVCTYLTSEPSLERARAKANALWAAGDVVEVELFAERTVRLAKKRR